MDNITGLGSYALAGAALAMLFRIVFRTLSRTDTETVRLVGQLRRERDRAQAWERWQGARADHWYAVALGSKDPPPIPPQPVDAPPDAPPVPIEPPK